MAWNDRSEVASDDFSTNPLTSRFDNGQGAWDALAYNATPDTVAAGSYSGNGCSARRTNSETYNADHYATVTMGSAVDNDDYPGPTVENQTTGTECYHGYLEGPTSDFVIWEIDISTNFTELASLTGTYSLSSGDTMTLEREGTTLRLGDNTGSGETERVSTTDNTLSGGRPGMYIYDESGADTDTTFSAWAGGNITAGGTTYDEDISEAVTFTDTQADTLEAADSLTAPVDLTDTQSGGLQVAESFSAQADFADAQAAITSIVAAMSNDVQLAELASETATIAPAFAAAFDLADNYPETAQLAADLLATVDLTDTQAGSVGVVAAAITENVEFADQWARQVAAVAALTSPLTFADLYETTLAGVADYAAAVELGEAPDSILDYLVDLTETVELADAMLAVSGVIAGAVEVAAVSRRQNLEADSRRRDLKVKPID